VEQGESCGEAESVVSDGASLGISTMDGPDGGGTGWIGGLEGVDDWIGGLVDSWINGLGGAAAA